jgi:hypothetical protein
MYLSLGLHKECPCKRKSRQPSKENIQNFSTKHKISSLNFFIFVIHFCPPGCGSMRIQYRFVFKSVFSHHVKSQHLKVVGNEKLGGLTFLQLLGIGLGPWRSIFIFILNMPFPNTKRISVSGLSSNMNRR